MDSNINSTYLFKCRTRFEDCDGFRVFNCFLGSDNAQCAMLIGPNFDCVVEYRKSDVTFSVVFSLFAVELNSTARAYCVYIHRDTYTCREHSSTLCIRYAHIRNAAVPLHMNARALLCWLIFYERVVASCALVFVPNLYVCDE